MFQEIADVLTPQEVQRLRDIAASARFVDGRISSPHSQVKDNLQIDNGGGAYAESSRLVATALQRSEAFRNFAYPRIMAPPLLARYAPDMKYGLHSDSPFMQVGARPLRSDLSCTVFLNEPDSYDGGELAVQLGTRPVTFKLSPGSAVVYPSTTLHEVRPVTRGERLVSITFIESQIADPVFRELLFQLDEVAALEGFNMSWENRTRLQYVRANLRRIWGEAG